VAGRRGARTGRGWDAAPARPGTGGARAGKRAGRTRPFGDAGTGDDLPIVPDEDGWPQGATGDRPAVPDAGRRSPGDDEPAAGPGTGSAELRTGSAGLRPASSLPVPGDARPPRHLPWSSDPDLARSDGSGRAGQSSESGPSGASGRSDGSERSGGSGRSSGSRRSGGRAEQEPRDENELAREICIRQLAVRPRTRAELAKALAKREISAEVIAEVLDRYDEVGMIDDAAFARAWVSSRHHGKGLARRALANELRQRGVDAETATEALETVDDDAEAAAARALVDRKLRSTRGAPEAVFRRLVGMLARKGYPAGVAIRAVKDALAARDAEAAEFADRLDADALADTELPET
jgi:regulatory protein